MSESTVETQNTESQRSVTLVLLLALTSGILALSVLFAFLDPSGFFGTVAAIPGRFFYSMLHAAAWWVPVYFGVLAALAARRSRLSWPGIILINLVHIPILTIAAILRLLTIEPGATAPLLANLTEAFTLRGAMLILSLVLALESVALLHVWRMFELRTRDDDGGDDSVRSPRWMLPAPEEHANQDDPADRDTPSDGTNGAGGTEATGTAANAYIDEPHPPIPLTFGRRSDGARFDAIGDTCDEEDDEVGGGIEDAYREEDTDRGEGVSVTGASSSARSARITSASRRKKYQIPVEGILHQYADGRYWEIDDSTRDAGEVLRVTLEEFGIKAEITGIRKGPVITMFEILPAPGVKLAKITNLADNIALRLAASSVRIVAPIPGKHAVGIEIPNKERNIVSFGELLRDDEFFGDRFDIPIALGKDIAGEAQIVDLTKTPHTLIAGATGSGKSVCVNSIICSILYRRHPDEVKLILIDPKIVELKFYNDIPHLLTPVITDPKRAFQALQYLIYEMERRYSLLDALGARDIGGYNAKIERKNLATEPLPYIVVLIDEFADLMVTSGKELESTVARVAAMSRAVGIHLVLATQRPSTDVITGLIKANIPSRIAFMVASKVDSRIIIDSIGAEKLLGRGDMLYTSAVDPFPVRMQGAFLSEDDVERVVAEVKTFGEPDYIDDEIFIEEDEDTDSADALEDPLMERAIDVVTSSNKASASYLQRSLKVGYNRAARMVEEMERMGIVGPQNGSKSRDVIGTRQTV